MRIPQPTATARTRTTELWTRLNRTQGDTTCSACQDAAPLVPIPVLAAESGAVQTVYGLCRPCCTDWAARIGLIGAPDIVRRLTASRRRREEE